MWKPTKAMPARRRIGLIVGGIGMAGLVAAAIPAVGAGSAATIEIANFRFAPPDLAVTAGTTVTWKNGDDSPHRIAADDGAYASAALDTGDSFTRTFATPGVYKYICSIHPYMKGEIVVKPAGNPS